MKLTVWSLIGVKSTPLPPLSERPVVIMEIRNAKATVSNLCALAAVKLKIKNASMALVLPSAAGGFIPVDGGEHKTSTLTQLGLVENDTIAAVSATMERSHDVVQHILQDLDALHTEAVAAGPPQLTPSTESTKREREESDTPKNRAKPARPHRETPRGEPSADEGADHQLSSDSEAEFDEEMDDEGHLEDSDDENFLQELSEVQVAMVDRLLALPNAQTLIQDFSQDPERVLRSIQEASPELFQLISQNHEAFLVLMDIIPMIEEEAHQGGGMMFLRGHGEGDGSTDDESDKTSGSSQASPPELTQEDEEKVKQLKELGAFSTEQCVRALLRCNHDTERAANFLFENYT